MLYFQLILRGCIGTGHIFQIIVGIKQSFITGDTFGYDVKLTVTVTVSLLEIAVKNRIARHSDKEYKLQNQTTRFKKNSSKLYTFVTNTIHHLH